MNFLWKTVIWFQPLLLLKMQVLILGSFECTFSELFQQLIQLCSSLPFKLCLTLWKNTILYELSLYASCQQHDSSMPGYPCLITQWFSGAVYISPRYFLFLSQAIPEILLYKASCLEKCVSLLIIIIISYFISNLKNYKRTKNSLVNILFNNFEIIHQEWKQITKSKNFSLTLPTKNFFTDFPSFSRFFQVCLNPVRAGKVSCN